jgi:hypothetical protein
MPKQITSAKDLGYHAYGAASNDANKADVPDIPDTVGDRQAE